MNLECKGPLPPPPSVDEGKPSQKDSQTPSHRGPRIRCPHCEWQPRRGDLWTCHCGCAWHTFDTGGVCPSCHWTWSQTQCPKCSGWSAHAAWYDTGDGGTPPN